MLFLIVVALGNVLKEHLENLREHHEFSFLGECAGNTLRTTNSKEN
jgi:hypothetical protein